MIAPPRTPLPAVTDTETTVSAPTPATGGGLRVLAFFCVLGLTALLLGSVIDHGLRRVRTSDFGVWNRIVGGDINADIVVSGSSRALVHYDPRVIEQVTGRSAFNIGLNGSQSDMQIARLKTYLRHNRKPSLVIHNLDAFSLQMSHGEAYDFAQYVPYLDEPDLYAALKAIDPGVWKSRWLPLHGYVAQDQRFRWTQGVASWFGWQPRESLFRGFEPRAKAWTGDFERFMKSNPTGVRVAVEQRGVQQIEDMLVLCKSMGIDVLLVYSPEYRPVQGLTTNRAEIFQLFETLSTRHGASFIDYSDAPISENKQYFYNSQHLNDDGASAFTHDLAKRLALLRPTGESQARRRTTP